VLTAVVDGNDHNCRRTCPGVIQPAAPDDDQRATVGDSLLRAGSVGANTAKDPVRGLAGRPGAKAAALVRAAPLEEDERVLTRMDHAA
jgi:hypothetical protein